MSAPTEATPYSLLAQFEYRVHERRMSDAFEAALALLALLQGRYFNRPAEVDGYAGSHPYLVPAGICERFAAGWAAMILDAQFDPSRTRLPELWRNLQGVHELIHGTAAGNLDHALAVLQTRVAGRHTADSLLRILLLWVPGSRMVMDWKQFYPHAPEATLSVAIAAVGGMVMCTPEAHRAREEAIAFLNSGMPSAEAYRRVGVGNCLHYAWMFCSYAHTPEKHRVKRLLNEIIRQLPLFAEKHTLPIRRGDGRPVMVVPLEQFRSSHAMYRCYAPVLEACRKLFYLVGIAPGENVDDAARGLFDVFHDVKKDCLRPDGIVDMALVAALIKSWDPVLVFYPSIGMQLQSLVLCNQRLAPVQAMTYGHPATSESPFMDYGLTEQQWIIDPSRFSENMIALPQGALRYALHDEFSRALPPRRPNSGVLRVAIPSFAQKWTTPFLTVLARAKAQAGDRIEFHFFSGVAGGSYPAAMNAVFRALPSATIHATLSYADYIAALAQCDVHAATFPFGGTNSVFDSLSCGLPVLCLAAQEIHGAQEEDFIRRVGLPEWLIAQNEENYVRNLVRLAEQPNELAQLQATIADRQRIADLFAVGGQPEAFAAALQALAIKKA